MFIIKFAVIEFKALERGRRGHCSVYYLTTISLPTLFSVDGVILMVLVVVKGGLIHCMVGFISAVKNLKLIQKPDKSLKGCLCNPLFNLCLYVPFTAQMHFSGLHKTVDKCITVHTETFVADSKPLMNCIYIYGAPKVTKNNFYFLVLKQNVLVPTNPGNFEAGFVNKKCVF